jgi:hypothetical protein
MLAGLFPDTTEGFLGTWSFWFGMGIGVSLSRGFWTDLEAKLDSDKNIFERFGGN